MSLIINGGNNGDSPSRSTLKGLFKALPGYVEEFKKKAAAKKAMRATHATLPRKVCKICCVAFDLALTRKDALMEVSTCEHCQKMLDDGWIACIEDAVQIEKMRFAFIRPPSSDFNHLSGEVLRVSTKHMDAIQKQKKDADDKK